MISTIPFVTYLDDPKPLAAEMALSAGLSSNVGSLIQNVIASTLTVTDAMNGTMLNFTGACVVTVPAGLRPDFSCGWSQTGVGVVSFVPSGVAITSIGGSLSSGVRYGIGGLSAFSQDTFRLYGALA